MDAANTSRKNWQCITGLVSDLKRCDEHGLTTASIALAYICIDSLANLARPIEKQKVTRSDFINWVNKYLEADSAQPYKYCGKDVYAARCAFLHTYGAVAELHEEDTDTIKFVYNNGGEHLYNPDVERQLVIIGTKSFINDVIIGVEQFLGECQKDQSLKQRVESRLDNVLQALPYPAQ